MKIKFIDLFAGIGGLRLGFENAIQRLGFEAECVFTSEIKEHAREALENNFRHKTLKGDITQVDAKEIEDFDYLLAGFPCQSFSSAGNRHGFLDTRGTLFFEVERILKEKNPTGFILENVDGIIKNDLNNKDDEIGNTLTTILKSLKALDYKVTWKLIDSKKFGVPQSRKRVFIVGTKNNSISLDSFNISEKKFKDLMEINIPTIDSHFTKCILKHYKPKELFGKAIKDKRGGDNNIHSWDIGLKGEVNKEQKELLELLFRERRKKHWAEKIGIKWMDGMPLTLEQIKTFYNSPTLDRLLEDLAIKGYLKFEYPKDEVLIEVAQGKYKKIRKYDKTKPKGYNIVAGKLSFEFTKILNPNDVTPTLVATDVERIGVIDNNGIRKLTIREGLRLFGFPESYNLDFLKNREAFDLLGNTVVVPVVEQVSNKILEHH